MSTIIGYLMPNPLYAYILNIYDWFGWVLWHINHYRYLMPNPLYTYILNISDLVWLGFMAYQPL